MSNKYNALSPMPPESGPPLPQFLGLEWPTGAASKPSTALTVYQRQPRPPAVVIAKKPAVSSRVAGTEAIPEGELSRLKRNCPHCTDEELLERWRSEREEARQHEQWKMQHRALLEKQWQSIVNRDKTEPISGYRPMYMPRHKPETIDNYRRVVVSQRD